jgi:outer membrane protein assembly factor BamD (BamD/ComL family)
MVKVRFLIERFNRKRLSVFLASILLLTTALTGVAPAQANNDDKTKTVRAVAKHFIQAGIEQYERGHYIQAEKSFLNALDYADYLTAAAREKLEEFLGKAHKGALERKKILEHVQTADRLIKQGYLIEARSHLEKVKDSEFLRE